MSDQPTDTESQVKLFGADISLRGGLASVLVITLCAATLIDPESYADTFKLTVTAVVAFYFGQAKK